ncbi:uncharacterized protein LOC110844886 [Folsomia candida]|uniref:uncharacterized protein LOC110844886 n=1 Tax=Folsomia candida TaxID=158441 RepID=UPI000B8F3631|nr:uncharacterized protein LOC110844886 [Folsomia candida]
MCFPKSGGKFPTPEHCTDKTGSSEYAVNYKQWCSPISSKDFAPDRQGGDSQDVWKQRYSFSKGPRFGIPPYCDCTPPPERFRFETTYNHDFTECIHKDASTQRHRVVEGIRPQRGSFLPKQFLCPFTTETTYSRAFDMPQRHYQQICSQNSPCGGGGCGEPPCCDNDCQNPCGIELRFSTRKAKPCWPRLKKEDLTKPGTDTSDCCRCPKEIPCCPCPNDSNLCAACCGCEFPCKLHQATTTPTRKYPIMWGTPRYVSDPRVPPRRPKLLCAGGTAECPIQNQFPTKQAIKQAKYRLMEALEKERCIYPPECVESSYRASYKTPPLNDVPKYCAKEQMEEARKIDAEVAERGLPPSCIPTYCMDGGKPPDPRPAFDHFSTYEADYVWDKKQRFKLLGGEIPCKFEVKPLCCPIIHASQVIKERTEEKERWGENWEICPPPQE